MESIVIKLNTSNSDRLLFNHGDNLFVVESQKVKQLIDKHLSIDTKNRFVSYNTIFINGSRGTGKTSFVNTLLDNIKNDSKYKESIALLDLFDPTMIEEKAEIFLTIISLIKQKVMDKIKNEKNEVIRLQQTKMWESYLETLAEGVLLMDESKNPQSFWDDSIHLMYRGLDTVNSSFKLRENFRIFVKKSLELLGQKFFLLVIDDVDTNTDKAYCLLEKIRKYLCIPEFIVIITGDITLYEAIVEAQKAKIDKNKQFELSDQYLRKILPINNRVSLKPINQIHKSVVLFNNVPTKLTIVTANDISFDDYLRTIFWSFGIKSAYIRQCYISFITNQSLRTQIDFYHLFNNIIKPENYPFSEPSSLFNVFSSELNKNGIDVYSAIEGTRTFCSRLLYLLLKEKCLNECYQLQPVHTDKSINTVLFATSLILTQRMKTNIQFVFDYFFRIAYIRNLSFYSTSRFTRASVIRNAFRVEDMIIYSGIYNDIDIRQISCHTIAYFRQFSGENTNIAGTIVLKGFSKKLKGNIIESKNTFDYELNHSNLSDLLKNIACLPLSVSTYSNKNESINEYSFFTLLASVFDLLGELKSGNDLSVVLPRIAQIKQYLIPSENPGSTGEEKTIDEIYVELLNDKYGYNDFIEQFRIWMDYCENSSSFYPPYILGKICTRICFAFNNIIKATVNNISLGDIMHLFVCELFHATLIEEFTELTSENNSMWNEISIAHDNISTSDKVFISNLSKIIPITQSNYLSLTKAIMTCPIFMYFLHFTEENQKVFDLFYQTIDKEAKTDKVLQERFVNLCTYEYFKENNLYETLNKIIFKNNSSDSLGRQPDEEFAQKKDSSRSQKPLFSTGKTKLLEEIKLINQNFSYEEFMDSKMNSKIMELFEITNTKTFSWGMYKMRNMVKEDPSLWS
ncbi:MAG: hypothetical protein J5527_05620 [Treponema sp.]|nr:hypothetical protein [Treponema sp.]